jgi:hypothetical protein
MRIFSATLSLWSMTKTFKPACPATPAQNNPAAPAPMMTTSNWCELDGLAKLGELAEFVIKESKCL